MKLSRLLNQRVHVKINDFRMFEGILIGYDIHVNLVLKECIDHKLIEGQEYTNNIGLIVLRGITVQTIESESLNPPPINQNPNYFQKGVGSVVPYGRKYT